MPSQDSDLWKREQGVTPREIIALTIGILAGLMFAPRAEPCRRGCCVPADPDARRERWRRGEDPEPPTS